MNPYTRARRISEWKAAAYIAFRSLGRAAAGRQLPILVTIEIPFTTNRKRDPHNYCGTVLKAVIDALVRAGVVPDDTAEWIGHREPRLVKGDTVVVELEPLTLR